MNTERFTIVSDMAESRREPTVAQRFHKESLPITLTVRHISAILGISRIGAYNLCHAVGFPSIRIGKRILIPRDNFFEWINDQAKKSA